MPTLLDAAALLWYANGDARLSSTARAAIENTTDVRWLSAATTWELAIKSSLGKLEIKGGVAAFLSEAIQQLGLVTLPVSIEHTLHIADLPFHHRDPFDRLLIAQALVEAADVITPDSEFARYGVRVIW